MADINFKELLAEITKCENTVIVGHSHPDGDCVGSAAALSILMKALGKKAYVIFPEPSPRRLEFLLDGIEVLYELPENLDDYSVICVDVASPVQMASLREAIENRVDIRIDHHALDTPYAKHEFVDSNAAAAGEIITLLYDYAKSTGCISGILTEALTPLFGAISSDTGCFKYANASARTHLCAAYLIEAGVNSAEINRLLFDSKEPSQLKAEGIAASRLETFADGKISGIAIELSDYENGLNIKDFETSIDIARSLAGVKCAVSVKASPTPCVFRASLRSNDDTDVSKIAAIFGGGGHIRAAGCSVEASCAKEALGKLIAELEKVL